MARIGFKHLWDAGVFDDTAVADLFVAMANTLTTAGFRIADSTATRIGVLRSDAAPGVTDDDTPHWLFELSSGSIQVTALKGVSAEDPQAHRILSMVVNSLSGYPSPTRVGFAADGREGWWWLHISHPVNDSPSGFSTLMLTVGTTLRRHPVDRYPGLAARFGLFDGTSFKLPFYRDPSGFANAGEFNTGSPLGRLGNGAGTRHVGSPLPRMAVPIYPMHDSQTACVLGELDAAMLLTDGYAMEETVMPGWVAWVGNPAAAQSSFALPAPDVFGSLPA